MGNSNLFAYLRFCVSCGCEEKKIENKKNEKSLQCNVLKLHRFEFKANF